MKKLALALVFFLTPLTAFAATSVVGNGTTNISVSLDTAKFIQLYDTTLNSTLGGAGGNPATSGTSTVFASADFYPFLPGDTMALVLSTTRCSGTLSHCQTTQGGIITVSPINFDGSGNWVFTELNPPTPPPPPSSGIADMISFSNATFASTTGFTIAASAAFAGDTFFNLFAGSGLAVLYELRWWIVALIMIAAVIYFGFRALRFFNH